MSSLATTIIRRGLWECSRGDQSGCKDKLTRPMRGLRMFMDSLELSPACGTRVCVSLCGYPLQSGRLSERDASVLTHSFASRFCDGERFFGSAVLCEDGFGAGGPLEGLWVLVSMLDPLVNRGLEFDDVVEGSSSDALASDFGEEPLDETSGSSSA